MSSQALPLGGPGLPDETHLPWYRQLTGYHWFVFLVASAAWFFDCLDQRIFSLARNPALDALPHVDVLPGWLGWLERAFAGYTSGDFAKVVTAFFLIGWGVGGMIFGSLGDKMGRARMLTITILTYSVFTGLSYFSHSWFDFTAYRFLTGLGVGGVFGLAVALIAETVPPAARAPALGLLQVLSTIGNITAGLAKMAVDRLQQSGTIAPGQGWRWMFLIGALPAVMVIFTGRFLREPASWLRLKETGRLPKGGIFSPYGKLFRERRWRRNLVVGALIASTGVIGLWAIGEYALELQTRVFKAWYTDPAHPARIPADVLAQGKPAVDKWVAAATESAKATAYLLNMLGAAVGMWLFTMVAKTAGRRLAFLVGFTFALVVTAFVYWKMSSPLDAYWMMPLMGAAQLSVFAGFSIYLPELFPASLRSTGTSFCYNLGRFAAAGGSFFSAYLSKGLAGWLHVDPKASPVPLRYSAIIMCAIFLVGLVTLPFAPETKGKPLPEDVPDAPPEGTSAAPRGLEPALAGAGAAGERNGRP